MLEDDLPTTPAATLDVYRPAADRNANGFFAVCLLCHVQCNTKPLFEGMAGPECWYGKAVASHRLVEKSKGAVFTKHIHANCKSRLL